jgi:hypothetical protein
MSVLDLDRVRLAADVAGEPVPKDVGSLFPNGTGGLHELNYDGVQASRVCLLGLEQAPEAVYAGSAVSTVRTECNDLARAALKLNESMGLSSACRVCPLRISLGECPWTTIARMEQESPSTADAAFSHLAGINVKSKKPPHPGASIISSIASRALSLDGFMHGSPQPEVLMIQAAIDEHMERFDNLATKRTKRVAPPYPQLKLNL